MKMNIINRIYQGVLSIVFISLILSGCSKDSEDITENCNPTVINDPITRTITYPTGLFSLMYDGELEGADYWSDEPMILSAGVGFSDIVGIPCEVLDEDIVEQAGGAWLSDVNCSDAIFTSASDLNGITITYELATPYGTLKDDALGLDGLPIVFSWPVLSNTIDITDFQFTLNTGEIVTPLAAGSYPNYEYNERNTVVVFGEFSNRLKSTEPCVRYPIKCEIITDDTPLTLIGPNKELVSAVGLVWETNSSPYDENNGPRLVGAKLNYVGQEAVGEGLNNTAIETVLGVFPNDEFALYGGGDFRLRMLTTGGFSPDGVRGLLPTDYEKFFRIHAIDENGETITLDEVNTTYQILGGTLKVIGLSDLGKPESASISYNDCYIEDHDNYIDIILVGDEAAARNIKFLEIPSLAGGYSALYNPGGPGTTPFPNINYTSPGPPDLEPVIIALDNPMRISN
ncbi:hypothetical protein OAD06_00265 [Flavobacteriaceae bacterium]|nr:hypothetical protein [Flavobacteriaceae bacterium]